MLNETQKQERIEKPWAVYGWFLGPWGIGRVTESGKSSLYIRYSEGQLYSPELWKSKWVHRFKKYTEAIDYLLSKSREYSKRELTERVLDNFPKAVKKESLQHMYDLLSAYAPSQPKCTPCVTFGEVQTRIKTQEPISQRDLERYNIMKKNENVVKESLLWVY